MKRDDATERQITAADPGTSTWVSANAGSGKTRVLTDRVARLLLQGVPPQRVLCLTYTKAAATEMQNRLFKRLGRWVMAADRDLDAALEDLGVPAAQNTREARAEARTLFARAIETPGGLKIQTIHSFCAAMLRQFPLEAGVSPNFRELDARDAKALRDQILDEIAEGPDRDRLSDLAAYVTDAKIDDLGAELASERERLAGPVDPAAIFDALGIDPQMTPETVVEETFSPGDPALIARLVPALQSGSTQDNKAAAKLSALTTGGPSFDWLPALESVLLFGGSAGDPFGPKIGKFPTRGTQASLGDDLESLNAMMQRVADARPRRLALEAATKTLALLRFAEVFLPRYAEAKAQRGVLDFDDQILKARALLSDSSVAQWVLFRLDGGIDHILVDEAQDTSPPQWDVIRLLAEEFSSGEGAREDIERTIFVVGDPKQSIYSFQGADPRGFDRMRAHFKEKLKAVNKPFQFLPLHFSFRSSPAILRFVDDAFSALGHAGLGDTSEHIAFRTGMPGRVDVWPALAKAPEPDEKHWTDTVDQKADDDPRLELARKIACEIRDMVGNGVQIEDKDGVIRPVTPKDFLVLVRRRSEIFHEVIRACKEIGVPIAGSDRLRVGAELAVKDILALLNFAATPEDDLALACALRSPLFGWSEAQLYALAQPRKKAFLWEELRNATDNHPETLEVLQDVLKNADFLRPYELLERILTRHDGRGRLLARLGREAEDGIDALLSQAIDYESRHVPSLTGFLSWFHASEEDNKRQLDSSRDEVRVMTVHGAKGLEGSIVILPDCTKPVSRSGQKTSLRLRDDMVVWRSAKADAPPMLTAALEEEQRLEREERMRLLYVALTRAESWLIVAAAGETGSGDDSWYSIVAEAAERHGPSIPIETPLGTGTRIEGGEWPEPTGAPAGTSEENATAVPEWARVRPPAPPEKPLLLSPSKLGGDKILAGEGVGEDSDTAMLRGTRVHLLLEHLPQASTSRHRALALQLLQSPEPSPEEFEDVFAEAQAVLTSAGLAPIFGPETLAEVDVSAGLPQVGSARMFGTIDRLIVESDRVCAIDFKSNAAVPQIPDETPEGLLRQMGAYASALAQIFPDRRIETAILWTRTATLMPLPHEVVTQALVRATPS